MSGFVRFQSNSSQLRRLVEQRKRQALDGLGNTLSGLAKERTPVETGRLRASIAWAADGDTRQHSATEQGTDGTATTVSYQVTAPKDTVLIGTNVNYAVYVHENPNARHAVGQYKFIESAIRENRDTAERIIRRAFEEGLETE